jgi:hypothetical protein
VVAHEAIGVDRTVKPQTSLAESIKKRLIVEIFMENHTPGSTPVHNMVKGMFIFDSWLSWHYQQKAFLTIK